MLFTLGETTPAIDPESAAVTAEMIEEVLAGGSVEIAWQSIVSLVDRAVLGYEALARFSRDPAVSPGAWFAAAERLGRRAELELSAVRAAIGQIDLLPDSAFMSLNVSPPVVVSSALLDALGGLPPERIVIEIAEDAAAELGPELSVSLDALHELGIRLALDDTGSGLVSLRQLLGLHADIIKIDTDVTRCIDSDPTRQAIAYALKSLAERSGALSLAEGVETEEEAEMLSSLGIDAAQGYLFGRPEFLS
ncbi:MAG: EAL domain-containing protein [Acidimicrobiales bacterium]